MRHAESMFAVVGNVKEQVQSRNRIQMNVGLQVIAAADRDGRGVIGLGGIAVVGDGISGVERVIDGGGQIFRVGLLRRAGCTAYQGCAVTETKYDAGVERGELVCALIVRLGHAKSDEYGRRRR